MNITPWIKTLFASICLAAATLASAAPLKVGFAQTGAESAWRTANSESMKAEAAKRGIDLKFSDGQGKQENQIRALRSFIAQKVDAIVLAPLVETGWDPVLRDAKRAGIPVIITDRTILTADESLYACFIGSDFFEEGRMAADWLAKKTGGTGRIVELQGTPGSAPANERRKAFAEGIAKYPGLKIIDSQSGDFRRTGGGKPCVRGTRISVEFILELLASGASQDDICGAYPQVTREGVSAAIKYAAESLKNDIVWDVKLSA